MPGSEHVAGTDGCAQFSSHSSGDVAFGPDGKLYASAGDGASFRGADYGQANDAGYPQARPARATRPTRAARCAPRTSAPRPDDPLGIDGTIFRMDPDAGLHPATATGRPVAGRDGAAQPVAAHLPPGPRAALER